MVAKVLVEHDIKAGEHLIRALDDAKVAIKAAFWLLDADNQRYRLFLAMPLVDQQGQGAAYRRIQEALRAVPSDEYRLSLHEITAAFTTDYLVQALCKIVKTGPGINQVRVLESSVNGVFIDDALIYRTTQ